MVLPTTVLASLLAASSLHGAAGFAPSHTATGVTHRQWSRHATDFNADAAVAEPEAGEDAPETLEVEVATKPLGMVLESNADDAAAGVFCAAVPEESAAYRAGARSGDLVVGIGATDATSWTLEEALEAVAAAEAPVALTLERYPDAGFVLEEEVMSAAEKDRELQRLLEGRGGSAGSKVRMAPRRLPSAKKLARASTNLKFWQDPLMIGSAVFTVAAPLAVLLAAQQ